MDAITLKEFATRYTAAWCSQDAPCVASFYAEKGLLKINSGRPAVGRAAAPVNQKILSQGLRYVPRFFAAAIVGENPSVCDLQIKPLSSYVEIAK